MMNNNKLLKIAATAVLSLVIGVANAATTTTANGGTVTASQGNGVVVESPTVNGIAPNGNSVQVSGVAVGVPGHTEHEYTVTSTNPTTNDSVTHSETVNRANPASTNTGTTSVYQKDTTVTVHNAEGNKTVTGSTDSAAVVKNAPGVGGRSVKVVQ